MTHPISEAPYAEQQQPVPVRKPHPGTEVVGPEITELLRVTQESVRLSHSLFRRAERDIWQPYSDAANGVTDAAQTLTLELSLVQQGWEAIVERFMVWVVAAAEPTTREVYIGGAGGGARGWVGGSNWKADVTAGGTNKYQGPQAGGTGNGVMMPAIRLFGGERLVLVLAGGSAAGSAVTFAARGMKREQ